MRYPFNHFDHQKPKEWRERLSDVHPSLRPALERNIEIATRAFMVSRLHVVPHRATLIGADWKAQRLEVWAGPNYIRRQFVMHARSLPVPGVEGKILSGAIMPDGKLYAVPTEPRPAAPQPAVPPDRTPEEIAAALEKAKAAVASGAPRNVVRKMLAAFGVFTNEI